MADGSETTTEDFAGNEQNTIFTISIPDLREASDEMIAQFARDRDGRWSAQTKDLLLQFQTTRHDLNSSWACTWAGWRCPCCGRGKAQIARLSPGGVLLCRLEFHHDHLSDRAKRVFRDDNPRGDDREANIQSDRAQKALMVFVERFEETLICIDCNLSEGKAKVELVREIDPDSTFTPSEIASFIEVAPNRLHEVDFDRTRATWLSVRDDVAERLDFASRMAKRVAAGRHRREVAPGKKRDVVFSQFLRAAPRSYRYDIGFVLEARSTANDSAGTSPRPKQKTRGIAPSDEEFAEFDRAQQQQKSWARVGEDWSCIGCHRSKREIVLRSNSGRWTGQIHMVTEYEREDREERLASPSGRSVLVADATSDERLVPALATAPDVLSTKIHIARWSPDLIGDRNTPVLVNWLAKAAEDASHGVSSGSPP
ncbi:hypothetical protein CI1B_26310 [Bradyrhizobium ivorense]|uniref:Uncharacterized protein n=1 Tax=Bradyrhizobium ivorense TaxID=2511166 RepID=A0A508T801_9BRAD|nr:hypothetical protein [Bradyrhizobium ivorense]VIO69347.1 hypothetical protein CI1B_26310 [Bradyrhizobium ivorense]